MIFKSGVIALVGLVVCHAGVVAQKNATFPYQALVLNNEAPSRSGPGKVYYATDNLKQGTPVQVHRHDPGGWCPIRPPEGSFSLIPESTVEIVEEGIGEIVADGTQAWVGTRLGAVEKPQWQIKLKKGELVGILGEVSWPSPEGHSTIWYQIEPPAGEFRWVHISDLQLPLNMVEIPTIDSKVTHASDETTQSADNNSIESNIKQAVFESGFEARANALADAPLRQVDQSPNRGWRQASGPIGSSVPSSTQAKKEYEFSGQINNSQGFTPPALPGSMSSATNLSRPEGDRFADSRFDTGRFVPSRGSVNQMSLAELDFQLGQEMIKTSPEQWQLEDIKLRTQAIRDLRRNQAEVVAANRLMEKLENCHRLRADHIRAYNQTSAGIGSSKSDRPIGPGVDADVELGSTYDAHGYLAKLERDNGLSEPTYVLQDENGKITHHVSATPGLNLHRYLKQKVGLIGQRGYHQKFNLKHVTAERVAVLNRYK